jgi:hypothetical protein
VRSERSKLGRWVGITLAAATIIGGGLAVAACSNGGEGDACNYLAENNGDDDCQDGLICWQAKTLNGAGTDLCCPPDRAQATTAACAIPATAPGVDAAIPADSGPTTDGETQSDGDAASASDTSSDVASDTSTADGAAADGDDGG